MSLMLMAAQPEFPQEFWRQITPSRSELGLIVTSAAVITLLALIWAIFIRKREDEGSRRYSYPPLRTSSVNGAPPDAGPQSTRKSRRRRKRRHRRNPTLAETGGLPPIRGESLPDDPP
jgi:hypothetical protein